MGIEIIPPQAPLLTAGGTNQTVPVSQTPSNPVSATAAVNTAVTINIAASGANSTRLTSLSGSYNAAPTGGVLTVVVNAVTILQLDITAAGPFTVPLPDGGIEAQAGQAVVITLSAAGAAVAGRLNVSSYTGA